ncbi:MAG: ABC transporter ATP-binding protein [Deltaproteobacteria bacterium]|nr:MAG: ABC transporter ATP-binding protein [Deltaproteobacteria bacterium]PIE72931.1 MAG: ABC transporter ATP-binding protein [Deltaproteobacteria bacterium]
MDRQGPHLSRQDTGTTGTGSVGLCCHDIDLSFEGRTVFEKFALDFEPGRWTCLLGPSGCGKSSLLRILTETQDFCFSGSVCFSGTCKTTGLIAWMSQKDLLLPWLRVLDNIVIGARLRGELDANSLRKAEILLEKVGMAGCGKLYPGALSGGMRQRVALLRTLMEERPVLLMDEPFSALDALTRFKLQNLAARLARGKTVVLVTHDPFEALRLGHRVVVLGGSPANVVAELRPGGAIPRTTDGPEFAQEHAALLQTLFAEEGV